MFFSFSGFVSFGLLRATPFNRFLRRFAGKVTAKVEAFSRIHSAKSGCLRPIEGLAGGRISVSGFDEAIDWRYRRVESRLGPVLVQAGSATEGRARHHHVAAPSVAIAVT